MKYLLRLLIVLSFALPLRAQIHLATVAATLDAGEFAVLNESGDGSGYEDAIFPVDAVAAGGRYEIYDFAYKGVYDRQRGVIMFTGGAHLAAPADPPHDALGSVHYNIVTNTWSAVASSAQEIAHADAGANFHYYGHQTYIGALRRWLKIPVGQFFDSVSTPITGIWQGNTDHDDPDDIDDSEWSRYPTPVIGTPFIGWIEYFPDRRTVVLFNGSDGQLWEKHINAHAAWTVVGTYIEQAPLGVGNAYNPVRKHIIFGGGGPNDDASAHNKFRILGLDGTVSDVITAPVPMNFQGHGLIFSDPVSGEDCFIVEVSGEIRFYTYDSLTDIWTRRTTIEDAIPAALGPFINSDSVVDIVAVPLDDYGVIAFLSDKVHIYKHTANDRAAGLSQTTKTFLPGFLASFPFDAKANLNPMLAGAGTAADLVATVQSAIPAAGYTLGPGFSENRAEGEGVSFANKYRQADYTQLPVIDTFVKYAGDASFRLDTLGYTSADQMWYRHNIDGALHDGQSRYISPVSPDGPVLYLQYKTRFNAAQLDVFRAYKTIIAGSPFGSYAVTTPGAGSAVINVSPAPTHGGSDLFVAGLVGETLWIHTNNPAGNFTQDLQVEVTAVNSTTQIEVTPSPTPAGAGTDGWIIFGGDPDSAVYRGTLSATSMAPTVLVRDAGDPYPFTADMVGKTIVLYLGGLANVGAAIQATITGFTDSTHVTLNGSIGPISNLYGVFGNVGGGWKQLILIANPPGASHAEEIVLSHGGQFGFFPQLYYNLGNEGITTQVAQEVEADVWYEITMRVQFLGPRAGGGVQRTQVWAYNLDTGMGGLVIDSTNVTQNGAQDWGGDGIITATSKAGTAPAGTSSVSGVYPSSTSGSGVGALYDISWTGDVYTVTQLAGGSGYSATNTLTFLGTVFGGTVPANNLVLTVSSVANSVDGLGQIELINYQTNKDPLQDHAAAYMWIDDLITSLEPIPMNHNGADAESPPLPEPPPPGVTGRGKLIFRR